MPLTPAPVIAAAEYDGENVTIYYSWAGYNNEEDIWGSGGVLEDDSGAGKNYPGEVELPTFELTVNVGAGKDVEDLTAYLKIENRNYDPAQVTVEVQSAVTHV